MVSHYIKSLSGLFFIVFYIILAEQSLDLLRWLKNNSSKVELKAQEPDLNILKEKLAPFTFNSPRILVEDFEKKKNRIWFSSSSHAADKNGIKYQFPNLICELMGDDSCFILNDSKPGQGIRRNIQRLHDSGKKWSPQYTVLYQMSLDIQGLSKDESKHNKLDSHKLVYENRPTLARTAVKTFGVNEFVERMSLNIYPREFIGSTFLLNTLMKNKLSAWAAKEFELRIKDYIKASKEIGAEPVIVTFVSAHSAKDPMPIPWRMKTWSMIWDEDMSPRCFVDTIESYNEILRRIAVQNDIYLIDLDKHFQFQDRKQYFDDFVHFNKKGHKYVAKLIAADLNELIRR